MRSGCSPAAPACFVRPAHRRLRANPHSRRSPRPVPGSSFYASPTGRPQGRGTAGDPWDLATALSGSSGVEAGDTIWLRGGTYAGAYRSRLEGAADRPIIVRALPGERATLDGGATNGSAILTVEGSYTWYWGFEVTSSDPLRQTSSTGSWPSGSEIPRGEAVLTNQGSTTGPGLRFINLVLHDTRQGVSFWKEAIDGEVYGSLIYYNGWESADRGHGHGIYTQNETGTKRIADNIIFSGFSHGIHAYGSDAAPLDNFDIEGNTVFNSGDLSSSGGRNLLLGGGRVARSPTIRDNLLYYPTGGPVSALDVGFQAGCTDAVVTDNYASNGVVFVKCLPVSMTGNTFLGSVAGVAPAHYPENDYLAQRPTGQRIFLRPNQYEPGRANITIYNWDLKSAVDVDLGAILAPGDRFEIRNVQDFFGEPVVAGTYESGPVSIPMAGLTVAAPVGWPAPPPTGPEFNAFVLITTEHARRGPETSAPDPRAPRTVERPSGR